MTEAFRQSFPPQIDLPPAMSALIVKLAALEEKSAAGGSAGTVSPAEKEPRREPQMA
jgi:hypothetical protein